MLDEQVTVASFLRLPISAEREFPAIDPMGIDHDLTLPGLPEDLRQPDHRYEARRDDVAQHRTRPDRWELVHVTHQNQTGSRRDRLQEGVHQHDVDHRGLVYNDQVGLQRSMLVPLEPAVLRAELQEPVDGLGLPTVASLIRFAARPVGEQRSI